MSFHVSNLSLTLGVADVVRGIGKEIFSGSAPPNLHHYTSAATVESIITSRVLWATCIGDQKDKTEVSHASELVTRLAERLVAEKIPAFAADVLRRLPFYMEERKQWIYIACFCDDHDSALHWKEYGDYCLTFAAPWTGAPALKLFDTSPDCWYQRVIYDEKVQQSAMERSLKSIVEVISRNTSGRNEGPWANAMVDSCARNVAQLLLGVCLGFKRKAFKGEREWRIVCAPRLGSNNSAPTYIDEAFGANIKQFPRRHIPLQIKREQLLFQPLLIPPVPFIQCRRNPRRDDAGELQRINKALHINNRLDLACL